MTGGAGFIGYHVAVELLEHSKTVIIVDNFNDDYDVGLKKARAKILSQKGKYLIIETAMTSAFL